VSALLVREARAADAAVVAELINAINSLDGPPALLMSEAVVARDLIGPEARAWLRVAELGGELVGFATAGAIYDAQRQADALMLLDLYVRPASRRRGAARALMAALAAEARRRGAAALWWGVDEGDDEATLFYRAIGARSEGRFSSEIVTGAALLQLAEAAR
jgi:ribosomal protein S18 acetylase RimI-like enzyme